MTQEEIKKFLDKESYCRATDSLIDKCQAFVQKVEDKMDDLGIKEITAGGVTLAFETRRSRSGYSARFLAVEEYDEEGRPLCYCVDGCYSQGYYTGDFNCWISTGKRRHYVEIANAAVKIVEKLVAIEAEMLDEARSAEEKLGRLGEF